MKALDLVKMPLWVAELATGAKSFVGNPIIGNPTLNRWGLHEKRVQFAERMANFRRHQMTHLVDTKDAEAFARDGFVIRQNLLSPDIFERLKREIEGNEFAAQEMLQGHTITRFTPITRAMLSEIKELNELVSGPMFQGLLRYVASRNADPIAFIHTVFAEPDRGPRDPQTVFHSDTFHATAKCWYFLTDVPEDGGPFTYVPGSHKMTAKRLAWERQNAINARSQGVNMSSLGSFRITDAELGELGYREPVRIAVPANTLVVADTHGFHARSASKKPTVRLGIYGSLRRNPFVPWAGLDPFSIPGLSGRQAEFHDAINNWKTKTGRPTGQPPVGCVKPLDPPVLWR